MEKSEVISWFRIQEMFRFDSIHMYGIIGLGMLVPLASAILGTWVYGLLHDRLPH